MSENSIVADGKIIAIHFSLTLDSGETVDSSAGRDPLLYLHGNGNIVGGLEAGLAGLAVGAKTKVKVTAKEGYGPHQEEGVQEVPREAFPDDVELEPGMQFQTQDEAGNVAAAWVKEVSDTQVTVDFNHPLAGQNLNFEVEIVEVRDATAEETEHGHPHGVGGHEH